jgi:hypothetical protein
MSLCEAFMAQAGLPEGVIKLRWFVQGEGDSESAPKHQVVYRKLRGHLRGLVQNGEPLAETLPPYNGRAWRSGHADEVDAAYNIHQTHPHGAAQTETADWEEELLAYDTELVEGDLDEFQGPTLRV